MNLKIILIIIVIILLIVSGFWLFASNKYKPALKVIPGVQSTAIVSSIPSSQSLIIKDPTQLIDSSTIVALDPSYKFSLKMPAQWKAEAVAVNKSINFFDPTLAGNDNLEKSQIFIRQFSGNDFLTLNTVNILERQDLTINNRQAVKYKIEKKPTAVIFSSQPSWRNLLHFVTDIRVDQNKPSLFYVIAQRPGLDETIYQEFLKSLNILN